MSENLAEVDIGLSAVEIVCGAEYLSVNTEKLRRKKVLLTMRESLATSSNAPAIFNIRVFLVIGSMLIVSSQQVVAQEYTAEKLGFSVKGTLGFVLGESKELTVGKAVLNFELLTEINEIRSGDELSVRGGRFIRWEPSVIELDFKKNVLGNIAVYLRQSNMDDAFQTYDEVTRKIVEKYGTEILLSSWDSRVEARKEHQSVNEYANMIWMEGGYILYCSINTYQDGSVYVRVNYRDAMLMNVVEESDEF